MNMIIAPNGRKHGLRARRARLALMERRRTSLTFERGAQAYHWTSDRGRHRLVIKH